MIIFFIKAVSGAVTGMLILVESLKQTEYIIPKSVSHLRYTSTRIPSMNMIYGPWILLKPYHRELLTPMSFIGLQNYF